MMMTCQRKMEKLLKPERLWQNRADEPLEFPAAKFRYLAFDDLDKVAASADQTAETVKKSTEITAINSDTTSNTTKVNSYQQQQLAPLQKTIARLISRQPKSSLEVTTNFTFDQSNNSGPNLECDLKEMETLLKNATSEDTVPVHSEILGALLRDVANLQIYNNQLVERLKTEKIANERLQLLQAEQCQSLADRVDHLEAELAVATRHQVTCSICLDSVDEILGSQTPKRSLLVTFCGHLFCDQCLQRSVYVNCCRKQYRSSQWPIAAQVASTAASSATVSTDGAELTVNSNSINSNSRSTTKQHQHTFSCPRCRKTLPSSAEMLGKFAHQLFV